MTRALSFRSIALLLLGIAGGGCPRTSTPNAGQVALAQSDSAYSVSGIFMNGASLDDLTAGVFPGCTTMYVGSCLRLECASTSSLEPVPAGALRVAVNGADVATATPNASGSYLVTGAGTRFSAGDTVTFSAAGDEVPAFTGSVTAPEALEEVSLPTTVSASAGLTMTWDATVAAEVVALTVTTTTSPTILVSCRVDASEGTIAISPQLLGGLTSGSSVSVAFGTSNFTEVTAGDFRIRLAASQGAGTLATVE